MISIANKYTSNIIIYAEYHTLPVRLKINNMIRKNKPDFLLSEEIGSYRYYTNKEKEKAIKNEMYSTGPESLKLSIELNIPIIGFDTWNYDKNKSDKDIFQIREKAMLKVLKEFENKGNIAIICGESHIRSNEDPSVKILDESVLYNYCKNKNNIQIIRVIK